jgi:hypothetical protein
MTKLTFSYLEYYVYCICPRLKEIDLLIKTSVDFLSASEIANILILT